MQLRRALPAAAVTGSIVFLGAALTIAVTGASSRTPSAPDAKARAAAEKSPSAQVGATPSDSEAAAEFSSAVSGLTEADGGHVSVAVENLETGATGSYNVGDDYVTASIVKLDILCTLLYQDQRRGDSPSAPELKLITSMIEDSDNDAAQDLFEDEGGSSAITAANKVFGLSDTTVQKNTLDEAGYSWGDTTTTVLDQLQLLRQVFTSGSVLNAANRSFAAGLMAHVEPDQRWGVSAAADDPSPSASDYMVKNGWLPRSTGLWEINTIGEVRHDGQEYLVAVLSNSNETMDSGIDVVQRIAKAAVDAPAVAER
jgi:hypothetical protein